MAIKQDVIITPGNALRIYTDGSFKDNSLGASAVVYTFDEATDVETEIAVRISKPTKTLATPSKAEKHGILNALMSAPYACSVTIRTDSDESVKAISKITSGVVQDRQLLKLQNHVSLTSISHEMSRFAIKPETPFACQII